MSIPAQLYCGGRRNARAFWPNCRNQAIPRFDRWSLSAMAMLRQKPGERRRVKQALAQKRARKKLRKEHD
jgi:hypothetical protein